MYTRDNYEASKNEIEARRVGAIATAEERNAELSLRSPEIRAIDEELRKTGLELFRIACSGGSIDELKEKKSAFKLSQC